MDRRKYLALASSTIFLAGCESSPSTTSSTEENSGGNPYFEQVSANGPTEVSVAETFSLQISAKNTGGRTGNFNTELTVNPNAFNELSYQVSIKDVEPGESKTTTIGPIIPLVAGQFRFIMEEYNAAHNVSSQPLTGELGDSLQLANDVELTLEDLYLTNGLFYATGENSVSLSQPENSEGVFVVTYVNARNRSDEEASPYSGFTIATESDFIGSLWTIGELKLSGEEFTRDEPIPPGKTHTGWLIFEIERPAITSGIEFAYNVDLGLPAEAYWGTAGLSEGGKPPEFRTDLTTQKVESLITNQVTVEVENTGDYPGVYTDMFTFSKLNSDSAIGRVPMQQKILAGETAELSQELEFNYSGSLHVSSESTGYETGMDVIPAQKKFGSSVTTASDIQITVKDLRLTMNGPVVFEDESSWAPSGQWMLAHVHVKNRGEEQALPPLSSFAAKPADNPIIEPRRVSSSRTLTEPVHGPIYPIRRGSEKYPAGGSESGWILIDIPMKYSFDDVGVRWSTTEYGASGAAEWWR